MSHTYGFSNRTVGRLGVLALVFGIGSILLSIAFAQPAAEVEGRNADRSPSIEWGRLSSSHGFELRRTKVPGGWFIVVCDRETPRSSVKSAFFYPDAGHSWEGAGEPN